MTDLLNEVKKAKHLLQEKEYELLIALGLNEGEEPNQAQRVEVLGKLYELVQQHVSPELQEAMKAAQATGNYSHPIDAMEVALTQGTDPDTRLLWEATHKPHVMKVKRPPLRD